MTTRELGQLEGSLEGLRALARSLVHGDADADDLLQDAAVAALEHPPRDQPDDGPHDGVRGWLAAVVRNRWRMDRRRAARRRAREQVAVRANDAEASTAEDGLDRARALERLSAALVALDEPFRTTVIRRYLDGQTAAQIARALGVPAGTVRWRLKTGLARLRAHLDQTTPRWQRALALGLGATVKTKTSLALVVVLLVVLAAIAAVAWLGRAPAPARPASPAVAAPSPSPAPTPAHRSTAIHAPPAIIAPRAPRAIVEPSDAAGGVLSGRVVNWSTGDGVVGAELTFTSDAGASTIRSQADGAFELAPPAPGRFVLTTIAAPGFLPYAPELLHSTVHVVLARDRAVRGVTVFLFPALDYLGTVVDSKGAPVAGARVRLLGTPSNEQAIDRPETEWTTDRDGRFTFHAADDAVLEAQNGERRGWSRLDAQVAITKRMTIALGEFPARDSMIRGHTVDARGNPIADVLIRASPAGRGPTRSTSFATSGPDGAFTIRDLDRLRYALAAEADGMAPTFVEDVAAGTDDVKLTLDAGLEIAGQVVDPSGAAIPSYTLLVARRIGIVRELMVARSIVDPRGAFAVRVENGDYELIAAGRGWAPSAPVHARAGTTDVTIALAAGGVLRGRVVASDTRTPVVHARIMREANGGGASAQPSNAGTVTDTDGNFELTGIPAGPLSIAVAAADFHGKIEAGMTASDGGSLGPITIALDRLAAGEAPSTELVGIGATLAAHDDTLEVTQVFAGSGAEAAGIVAGDRIIEIDGAPVAPLGVDGAIAKIRGVAGTTLTVTLRRHDAAVKLLVQRRKLKA